MTKILHVSYSMDTGGGPITIKRIVEDFKEHEYFISGNAGVFMDYFETVVPKTHILKLHGPNLALNTYDLIKFCKKHSIEIVHVHGRGAASFARFVKLFIRSIKIIYTPNGFFPRSLPLPLRLLYIAGERILFEITDIVFFVSESEKKTFSQSVGIAITNRKLIYIQNYIDASLTETKKALAYQHPLPFSPKFLFIGRLSKQKGVDILVESLKLINKEYQLTIIGYGEMEGYLKSEIGEHLSHRVTFIGKLNEAFRYMPNFDALLLPSRFEGLPFTVLEAMLYGLPLIVTPCNGTIDLVDQQNGYLADSVDARSFATAIESFLQDFANNPNVIKEMTIRNLEKVKTEYSKEAVQQKIDFIYS
jgi:glycosyltransferase involved in cell wall biosynthesis